MSAPDEVTSSAPAAPVERKVNAASAGAAVSGFVLWALNAWLFHGTVPAAVAAVVLVVVPGAVAWVSGYVAKHTPR